MPLFGLMIILALCTIVIWVSMQGILNLVFAKNTDKHPVYIIIFTLILAVLMGLAVWLGAEAITFNLKKA